MERICALLLTALILCGCAKIDDTPAVETATPAETVPAATVPSDGDPKNVTCTGSYTGQGKEQTVIASVGKRTLTNGQLADALEAQKQTKRPRWTRSAAAWMMP